MKWAEVRKAAPVLNRADFHSVFGGDSGVEIPRNRDGHPEAYEFVALPGQSFQILSQTSLYIYQIAAVSYAPYPLYTDMRFCEIVDCPQKMAIRPLTASYLLQQMERRVGIPYVWGGNWADGIPEMLEYYPPSGQITARMEELWAFRGLDCSGLLFEASHGACPRNSSALVTYGKPLETAELRPMDMIVYPGHVLFVRDEQTIIESKSPFGVRIAPLQKRLEEIRAERTFAQHWESLKSERDSFTIRRFCKE